MLWAEVGISVLIICKFSNEWTCTRKKNVEGFGCGDATALGSNYAVNDQDFHWVVVHEFNATAGVCKMCIWATPCDMMKSTCSSIKVFQANNA